MMAYLDLPISQTIHENTFACHEHVQEALWYIGELKNSHRAWLSTKTLEILQREEKTALKMLQQIADCLRFNRPIQAGDSFDTVIRISVRDNYKHAHPIDEDLKIRMSKHQNDQRIKQQRAMMALAMNAELIKKGSSRIAACAWHKLTAKKTATAKKKTGKAKATAKKKSTRYPGIVPVDTRHRPRGEIAMPDGIEKKREIAKQRTTRVFNAAYQKLGNVKEQMMQSIDRNDFAQVPSYIEVEFHESPEDSSSAEEVYASFVLSGKETEGDREYTEWLRDRSRLESRLDSTLVPSLAPS